VALLANDERLARQREPQLRGKVPAERLAAVFVSSNDTATLSAAVADFRIRLRGLAGADNTLQPYLRRTAHHA